MARADLYHQVVGFARTLRGAGLPVGVEQSESFAGALACVDTVSRRDVYLAARATLVFRREDLPVFDDVFAAFFGASGDAAGGAQTVPLAPRHDRSAFFRTALVAYMAERVNPRAPEVEIPEQTRAASPLELLRRKDFGDCTRDELDALARALRDVRFDLTVRESLRLVGARRGDRLDMRRVLRNAASHGGVALALHRRRRKLKRRPLVVLADISGSMERYSRILLQFLHGITHRHGRTETFVFGTRLTCITSQLQIRDVDTALTHAAREIVDFAGGTRIGECLRTFNRLHARRVLRAGAVLLLISDGWETGDAALLDVEMRRLRERCHRVVWLNPLLGGADYEPRARGMSIALAHVDDFLPVHNLQSLQDLSKHLARISRRKGAVTATPANAQGPGR
jgi:uncharacterized protein with von Willebrand factor type A (vWA) domain